MARLAWAALLLALMAHAAQAAETDLVAAMEKPLPAFDADAAPLARAAQSLGKSAGVVVRIDTARLKLAALSESAAITLHTRAQTPSAILAAMLDQAAADHALAFTFDDQGVLITVNRNDTGVFDIRDLLPADPKADPQLRDAAVKTVVNRILQKIAPDTWSEEHFAELREYHGLLHVRQNLATLTDIQRLLYHLRTDPPAASAPAALVMDDRGHDAAIETCLATEKISVKSAGTLEQAVKAIQDAADFSLLPNWRELAKLGIDKKSPITIDLREVPIGDAITAVFRQLKDAAGKVAFTVDDGTVAVSTLDDIRTAEVAIKVYDVRDLIGDDATSPAGAKRAQAVVDDIETSIEPATWKDKGGTIGAIRPLNGQLIVNQSPAAQRAIYNYIQLQRRERTIQITIESRLLAADAADLKKLREIAPMDRRPGKGDGAPEGFSVIDDFDTQRLMKLLAGQKSIDTTTSPRLTTPLAQQVVTRVGGNLVNVTTGWKKQDDGFAPTIDSLYDGIELAALPALSTDGRRIDMDIDLAIRHVTGEAAPPTGQKPATVQKVAEARIAGHFSWQEGWTLVALGPAVAPILGGPADRRFVLVMRTRLLLPKLEDYPLAAPAEGAVHIVK